uniref:Cytochrome b561 domain-containing protein n=1 Tax=Plectus sambesii TaxID=2011161 RepID=A0A914WH69_9BILA
MQAGKLHSNAAGYCRVTALIAMHSPILAVILAEYAYAQLSWQRPDVQLPLPPRTYSALGFDPVLSFLVVFGGRGSDGAPFGDTWVLDWNASQWYNATSTNDPSPRYGMSYGMYNRQLYIFGGCSSESTCYNDVWRFSASSFNWLRVNITDGFLPSPRRNAMGGIAPQSHLMVVSCGWNGGYLSDTFMLDLEYDRWIELESTMFVYSPWSPHPRVFAASTMISPTKMFVFGGCTKHGPCPGRDAWIFNGDASRWTTLDFCFDARREATAALINWNGTTFIVVFGGVITGLQYFSQTVQTFENVAILDTVSSQWSVKRMSGPTPGNRIGNSIAALSRGGALLFGGQSASNGTYLNDIWVLSGNPAASSENNGSCFGWFTLSLIGVHGLLMFIAFGIVLFIGSSMAHYVVAVATPNRCQWQYWHTAIEVASSKWSILRVHHLLQIVGTVLALFGFASGLLLISTTDTGHFRSVHGCLGLAVLLLLLVQAILPPM